MFNSIRADVFSASIRKNTMEKLAYTIPEAIKVTGIGRTTIYSMLQDGRLKGIKNGRRVLITAEALKESIASCPAYNPAE